MSLVELLIAMTLGLLIISATLAMVVATSRTNGTFDALARTQETGRLAMMILTRDVRLAGYNGCRRTGFVRSLLNDSATDYSDPVYDFGQPLFGWSEADVPTISANTLPPSFTRHYARGDVLIVKHAAQTFGVALGAPVEPTDDVVELDTAIQVPVGRLLEGVYDMRVRCGVPTAPFGGEMADYRSADGVTDWAQVVALRLSVLAYGGEGVADAVADDEYAVPFDETIWDFGILHQRRKVVYTFGSVKLEAKRPEAIKDGLKRAAGFE